MIDFGAVVAGSVSLLGDPFMWSLLVVGVVYGVIAGAMPGVGQTLAYGLVLPFTFVFEPTQAVAFLLAIAVGVSYGNSIPAILIGVPGTPAAVLTVMDGFKLHKRGESGLALGVAFVAALVGQLISIPLFVVLVIPLSGLAFVFLSPELFGLYLLGMVAVVSLTGKNVLKGLIAAAFGVLIGIWGLDPISGAPRFDVGIRDLRLGVSSTAVIIGLLAVSELFRSGRQVFNWDAVGGEFSAKFPSFAKIRRTVPAILGGTVVGTLIAAIPGTSGTASALVSYQQAKLISKHPEEFGNGSVEGIAANEAAQSAANSGELIPTLGLGIPGSSSMVLLLASLSIHGLVAGPSLTRETPELLYAAIAGMAGATIVLLVTGWWTAKLMLTAVTIDRSVVIVVALGLVVIGVFSLSSRVTDVLVCLVFGVIGYFMQRYGYSVAAAALAVVLADGFETTLRKGLTLFDSDPIRFVARPYTAFFIALAAAFLVYAIVGERRSRRLTSAAEERDAKAVAAAATAAARTGVNRRSGSDDAS